MPDFDDIRNTKYIRSLRETDVTVLLESFKSWPQGRQKEFIEGILEMEKSYDKDLEQASGQLMLGLEKTLKTLKTGEIEGRKQDEKIEKEEESEKAETMLNQL